VNVKQTPTFPGFGSHSAFRIKNEQDRQLADAILLMNYCLAQASFTITTRIKAINNE